ncbi:MAG TPA: hypothetical protein VFS15_25310, partial [Kofleriaceae bacterium]|nr:hypothetical protein [Kofleriaceae bacterium]
MLTTPSRRILRFFGSRGDLLAAESPGLVIYDSFGQERVRTAVEGMLDVATVDDEVWVVTPRALVRLSALDGCEFGTEPLDYLDPAGRVLQSSTAPQLPVWHAAQPMLLRARTSRVQVPEPAGDLLLPITEGRWLTWHHSQLRLWRPIGEAWRRSVGDPGMHPHDAQLVLDGRLLVLGQRRAGDDAGELRLYVVAVSDGALTSQLRVACDGELVIAARRGLALARSGDRLSMIDLRFGRWVRDLMLPPGVTDVAVDDTLQRIALVTSAGIQLVRPDALAAPAVDSPRAPLDEIDDRGAPSTNGHSVAVAVVPPIVAEPPPPEPAKPAEVEEQPFDDAPLHRLLPVSARTTASAAEIKQAVDARLRWVGARTALAIAEAWDCGRISRADPNRPPFAQEVAGLLGQAQGLAVDDLEGARTMLASAEEIVQSAAEARQGRLLPIDVLARDFALDTLEATILFVIAAPRLRGELARLYGILANDPGRPLVDEHLLGLVLGADHAEAIARALDGDRPLRRFGLVRVAAGERPFAAVSVDPLVVRYIANQPAEGEPDQYLTVRRANRELDELHIPRALIAKALRFLSMPRDDGPARIVVRGRSGSGRHTLLAT